MSRSADRSAALRSDVGPTVSGLHSFLSLSPSRGPPVTCSFRPACLCRQPRTLKRLRACGLSRGPNMRVRLLAACRSPRPASETDRRLDVIAQYRLAAVDIAGEQTGPAKSNCRDQGSIRAEARGLKCRGRERSFTLVYSAAAAAGWVSSRPRCATAAVEGSPSPATCTVGKANLMPFSSNAFLIKA